MVCGCGTSFETRHSQGKYCSEACRLGGMRASVQKYSDVHPDARREARSAHYEKHKTRVVARVKAYHKTDAGKAATRRASLNQKKKFPEKVAARQAVKVALHAGKLTKAPCEKCGALKVQAHHDDYTKPLAVRCLCDSCHKEEHRMENVDTTGKVGFSMEDGSVVAIDGEPVDAGEPELVEAGD